MPSLSDHLAAMGVLTLVLIFTATAHAQDGIIRATVKTEAQIENVWAVQRKAETLTTSQEQVKDIGMYVHHHAGRIDGDTLVIDGLDVPGRYDLRFEMADGGIVQGWDATVPASDYVGDPPLEDADRQRILEKQASDQFTAFADRVRVLDVQGNLQNAVLLVEKVRWRPFTGGGYKPGEWVWRVERWQWEDPNEQTWVPYQERPYYALVRERTDETGYRAKNVVYARHLGGVVLTNEQPSKDIGIIQVPRSLPGVNAVDGQGQRIEAVTLKGGQADASE